MSTAPLKVVIAAGLFPPDIGGPATYAAMVAERLPAHGVEVSVVPFGAVRMVPKWRRHLSYTYRLWQATTTADVVYALDPMSVGWPALLVSRLRRLPLVVRLGGDYAWEQSVQRFGVTDTLDTYTTRTPRAYGWRVRLFAWLQRCVVRRASAVIVPSEYLKRIVATWPGVDNAHIQVVYSALFPLQVSENREALRHQLAYNSFTICSAGRLVPWKGMVPLVAVLAAVRERIPDATLVIAGAGPEAEAITAAAEAAGLSDAVRLVGSLSKEALGAAMYAADVFVLNTEYEGLSHQLLEAMDLSVPVVSTFVGGNPELITDGVSGRLVAVHDVPALAAAIIEIATEPERAAQFRAVGKARSEEFSAERSVTAIAAILKQIAHD